MYQEGGSAKRISRDDDSNSCAIVFDCQDLLTSILLQFPAKTLVRLKLVSRQFRYVISHPVFCINHLRFHHHDTSSLAPTALYFYSSFSNCTEIYSVSISDNPPNSIPSLSSFEIMAFLVDRQFKILQSCNGLFLCCFENGNSSNSSSGSATSYFVCNPTTLSFTILPVLPRIEYSSKSKKSKNQEELSPPVLTLAFNPLQTHVYKVFGVKHVKQLAQKSKYELIVYSSDEGGREWRKSGCQFSIPVGYNRIRHGVFHGAGKITWICNSGFIHFDVQAEKVVEVKKRTRTWKNIIFFGVDTDGSFQLINKRTSGIDVIQLRSETSNWDIIVKLRLKQFLSSRLGIRSANMYQILDVEDRGKDIILTIPGRVIRYCQQYFTSRVLRELPQQQLPEECSFGCVNSFQFVETLSPV